jgi:hypothetical protein
MGTASSGGSGGGSGLRAGGGSGGGAGGFASSGGNISSISYERSDISNEVRKILTELFGRASTYSRTIFDNDYVKMVYKDLFDLSLVLRKQNSKELIGDKYNLDMNEPKFILNLINKLHEEYSTNEISSDSSKAVRQTLESFFFESIQDDPNLLFADGKTIVDNMADNKTFWKSLSGYFLSKLAITVYKKEIERRIPQATFAIEDEIERRTNQVIFNYQELSQNKKTNYKDLFQYIGQNWEWFKNEMLK